MSIILNFELTWEKTQGCFREFGLRETVRRMAKEILRTVRAPINGLDISVVTEKLAIGAAPKTVEGVEGLLNSGFNCVIDLRAERKEWDILVKAEGDLVIWIPTYDDWKPKPVKFFSDLYAAISGKLLSNSEDRLLICCGAGEHRAPLAGVLALFILGYSFDTSLSMIQKARPKAELLPVYISSLKEFLKSSPEVKS